jgi:hypothetical protein
VRLTHGDSRLQERAHNEHKRRVISAIADRYLIINIKGRAHNEHKRKVISVIADRYLINNIKGRPHHLGGTLQVQVRIDGGVWRRPLVGRCTQLLGVVPPARPFPSSIFRDQNRRDRGKSQPVWTRFQDGNGRLTQTQAAARAAQPPGRC